MQVAFVAFGALGWGMDTTAGVRIDPGQVPDAERDGLAVAARPVLLTAEGSVVEMPEALRALVSVAVDAVRSAEAVVLVRESDTWTTREAARFLGVSRQYPVRLLESGAMPFHRAATHRRVRATDCIAYRTARAAVRAAALDRMTTLCVEHGVYDRFAPPGDART